MSKPKSRDPRTDPQSGDVLIYGPAWQRERCEVTGTGAIKTGYSTFLDMVWYRIGNAVLNATLRSWREWMKDADVVATGNATIGGAV